MKLHENIRFKKNILQTSRYSKSADIIDQYGCKLLSEAAKTHAI